MKITVGEYLTRNGNKARVYATDGGGSFPVHGAVYTNGEWEQEKWTPNGCMHINGREAPWDLMTHKDWREALTPIFDALAPEYRFVAMDANGNWYAYTALPTLSSDKMHWSPSNGEGALLHLLAMPKSPAPCAETLTAREDCQ